MKRVYLLGAAGSIGLQTLDIIKLNPHDFEIVGLSLGSNHDINHKILNEHHPQIVSLREESHLSIYQSMYPQIDFTWGNQGLIDLATYPKDGLFINALSGSSGLYPTVEAIKHHKDIALANKETLVMAGDLINDMIKTYGVNLYPIDSEHSALWQVLRGESYDDIEKLIITASGGSFRDLSREDLKCVTLENALKHPNWSMGAKITIDSATMMNKGLEVIEAHHLFHLPYDHIETILHQESVIHGLVYFKDSTVKASLSVSDMRIPISYALYYPKRAEYHHPLTLTDLHFKPMDFDRFPLLKLAYEVGRKGGLLPTVMNAANEAAVKLFLRGKISFLDIEKIVFEAVNQFQNKQHPSIEDIILTNDQIQLEIVNRYEKR
ncbi:MAG: 1-deoxy-D-xylulose-5-phosphate reductoisomerase [Tenericutes bacterium GWC2_34_14]|nr:MAG: 1-deoxy-D-xylulose-5-phosphate reductoisomerase [Tenericutes bacterium GWA2_35_7]OHE29695.1 MAG: 1-deoxy-D-xylulose-5-phosphate reductoisomerase [Tenericutes bacterium GWC2_34_14]OHE34674.1 MAG: 1-deoxy-D-xylulose-5-phosphate reductoisomerase [Tenericutes bacterium GWE2_34_108]OHE37465.1 MAG: 1-deoxy-D-xylulose-5-phosphate reductoisomerase [Tenericutes bacterium GWF1_35_14]OHE39400.1 MAG: 1-deoxy-D-xylulose-5-phosphate reductoisomerase [Tenericutes bacterium GWF2_35_184]OHE41053.1 MAG: